MTTPIRILLADDEQLIRSGMAILLNQSTEIEIVGQVENGRQAFHFVKENKVDLVLMDIRMPNSDGIEGTQLIKEAFPKVKVLILTTFQDTEYLSKAMKYGASGYLLKDNDHEVLLDGIKLACKDKIILDNRVSQNILNDINQHSTREFNSSLYPLNDRQVSLIRYVASGLNNKEIASKLFLSEGTVRNNLSEILSILHLRDRTQLAIFAFNEGLMK